MQLHLEIVTSEATVYSGDVDMVTVPGAAGVMGILPRHAPVLRVFFAAREIDVATFDRHVRFFRLPDHHRLWVGRRQIGQRPIVPPFARDDLHRRVGLVAGEDRVERRQLRFNRRGAERLLRFSTRAVYEGEIARLEIPQQQPGEGEHGDGDRAACRSRSQADDRRARDQ